MSEPAADLVEGAGLRIQYDRGVYSVTYRKRGLGRPARYVALLLLVLVLAAALLHGLALFWLLLLVGVLLGATVLLQLVPSTGTFHFTRYLFSVGGRRYDRRQIHTLYLQPPGRAAVLLPIAAGSPLFGSPSAPPSRRPPPGLDGKGSPPVRAARQGFRLPVLLSGRRGSSVGFLLDGRQVPLATGLSAGQSGVLFRRLGELVG